MSEPIAISTYASHTYNAWQIYRNYLNRDQKDIGQILFAFGRTTPWVDGDTNPPIPELTMNTVEEIIGYKAPEQVYFVEPSVEGSGNVSIDNMRWSKVVIDENVDGVKARSIWGVNATNTQKLYCAIMRKRCRWLYLSTSVSYTDWSTSAEAQSMRQMGIFANAYTKNNITLKSSYYPSEISLDAAALLFIKNMYPVTKSSGQLSSYRVILEL